MKKAILFLTILALAACSGSKSMYKKGEQLRQAGMLEEATGYYMDALNRKSSNVEAMIALKKTGQYVLDSKLQKFYQAHSAGSVKEAVYLYREARSFRDRVAHYNVSLEIPPYYEEYYKEVEDKHVHALYKQVQNHLDNERFSDAQTLLKELKTLRPNYQETSSLDFYAQQEPKYRKALEAYDNGKFRSAYYLFKEIEDAGGYKESRDYAAISRENAQYTVGLVKIQNATRYKNWERTYAAAVVSEIMKAEDPFLKLIDRSSTDLLLQEQALTLSGQVDANTAAQAGELLGAKSLLIIELVSAERVEGPLQTQQQTGFLGKQVKQKDPKTGEVITTMEYSRTNYQEISQTNRVSATLQFKLISTETGEILVSDVFTITKQDAIEYAKYNGDARYLYPGTWVAGRPQLDKINNSFSAKRSLDQKLSAKRQLETIGSLSNKVVSEAGSRIASKLLAYQPNQ